MSYDPAKRSTRELLADWAICTRSCSIVIVAQRNCPKRQQPGSPGASSAGWLRPGSWRRSTSAGPSRLAVAVDRSNGSVALRVAGGQVRAVGVPG